MRGICPERIGKASKKKRGSGGPLPLETSAAQPRLPGIGSCLERELRTDAHVERVVLVFVAVDRGVGVPEPGVTQLGIEKDARAHLVAAGQDDTVQAAMAAGTAASRTAARGIIGAMAALDADGP